MSSTRLTAFDRLLSFDRKDRIAGALVALGDAGTWVQTRPAWQRHAVAVALVGLSGGLYRLSGPFAATHPLLGLMPAVMVAALLLGSAAYSTAILAFIAARFALSPEPLTSTGTTTAMGAALALILAGIAVVHALLRELRARPGPATVAALREGAAERRERDAQARRLADAVENASFGIVIADPVTDRIRFVNPAYAALRGYSSRALIGKPAIQAYALSELARIPAMMDASDRNGHVEFDTWYRQPDGSFLPVRNGITSVLNEKGVLRYRLIYAADATPKQRAEEASRESEARFRATFEQAAVGIAHLDPGGRILRVNDRFCAISGYTREELLRRRAQDLVVPDDLLRGRASLDALLEGRIPHFSVDRRQLRPNGTRAWVRATTSMVRGEGGQHHMMLVLADIGDLKTAEEALQHAQKMEAIGTLASGIAHDFNNVLAVVGGNLEIMMSLHEEDSEQKALAGSAIDAVMRAADLTRRLLAFSRRQPIDPRALDLNALLRNVGDLLRRSLRADITLDVNLAPGVWRVLADPGQAEAAVTNLVGNARDAMPTGGLIRIATLNRIIEAEEAERSPDVPAGEYVMIEVADTGTGIAPDVLPRVFEPFFTTKAAGAGTGLGLAMAFGFARQSDGFVRVTSALGEGTTFQLLLPRALGGDAHAATVEMTFTPARGSETVLVVEDNAELRAIVVRHLTELGYRVLEAEAAAPAIGLLERAPVDLLMTDMMLPGGINGLELARQARELVPGLPILLASSHADAMQEEDGGAPFPTLAKPFRASELARAVRAALG
ncbi:MAG: PAS domain S-box protein [Alphaproteobacteria bacterium]|nr:PAS domain S-box protein [Alphaproteobacteria bacterium]